MDTSERANSKREYLAAWYLQNKERLLARRKERYQQNKEHAAEVSREWAKRNPDKVRGYQKAYRDRNAEKQKQRMAEYYRKNKATLQVKKAIYNRNRYPEKREEIRLKNAEYFRLNREKIRAKGREYRLLNLEKRREQCRKWHADHRNDPDYKKKQSDRGKAGYKKHKDKIRAKHKEWLKRNPGYMSAVKHRRRLIENASKNLKAIKAWMKSVKLKQTAICYYCQRTVSTKDIHFDHIVSIANGGLHDVSNICVSCAPCNLQKQDKPIQAWVRIGQQVLSL